MLSHQAQELGRVTSFRPAGFGRAPSYSKETSERWADRRKFCTLDFCFLGVLSSWEQIAGIGETRNSLGFLSAEGGSCPESLLPSRPPTFSLTSYFCNFLQLVLLVSSCCQSGFANFCLIYVLPTGTLFNRDNQNTQCSFHGLWKTLSTFVNFRKIHSPKDQRRILKPRFSLSLWGVFSSL